MSDVTAVRCDPVLPHGSRFRLVHRITGISPDGEITGEFNFTGDEVFLARDHFAGNIMMSGALLQEGIAQTLSNLVQIRPEFQGLTCIFGACKTKWRGQVLPDSTVVYSGRITKTRGLVGNAEGEARVNGEIVCTCKISFMAIKSKYVD